MFIHASFDFIYFILFIHVLAGEVDPMVAGVLYDNADHTWSQEGSIYV